MIDIRDTFRDAEIETPKTSIEGERYGGIPHSNYPTIGGLGERQSRPKIDLVRFELNRTHL